MYMYVQFFVIWKGVIPSYFTLLVYHLQGLSCEPNIFGTQIKLSVTGHKTG